MRSEARRVLFAAGAALATGCALETPDLALDREAAVTVFCEAMEVSPVSVVGLGREAGAEDLPCRLTPGPATVICRSPASDTESHFVGGLGRPTVTLSGAQGERAFLAFAEAQGTPTAGFVERRSAFEPEPETADRVDASALSGPVFLPGHGLVGVELPWVTLEFGQDGGFDAFLWGDAAALPERRPQPRPPEPLSWTTEIPVLVSTGAAVCAAIRTDAGYRFQRLYPEPEGARPTPAVPGVLTEGPRPAVIATRFDGLLELREPTPDCTALRPPVVRAPPAVLRDPRWDGERLYVPTRVDGGLGFAVSSGEVAQTFIASNDDGRPYPVLTLLEGGAPAPGRPYLATALERDDATLRIDLYDAGNTHLGALAIPKTPDTRPLALRLVDGRLDLLAGAESAGAEIRHIPFAVDCRAP